MAFPGVAETATQSFSTGTSHVTTLFSTIDPNDLLIIGFLLNNNTTFTTPANWVSEATQNSSSPTSRFQVFSKVAVGNEDGTSVDFVTAVSVGARVVKLRISAATWFAAASGITAAMGTFGSGDPPNLAPGWGALDILWIIFSASDNAGNPFGTPPANYINGFSSSGAQGRIESHRRELNASSENPAAWTGAEAKPDFICTMAIRPASGGSTAFRRSNVLGTRTGSRSL